MKKYISMFLAVIICLSAFVGCVENGGNKPVADLPPAETPPRNEPTADEPITDEPSADEPIDPSVTPTEPTEPQQPVEPETPTEPSEPILPDIEDFPKYDPELFESIIAVDVERGVYVSRADGTVWRGQLYVDEDFNFDKAEFELVSQVPAKKLGAERYVNVIITENGDLLGDFEKVLMENVVDAEMTLLDGWALCEDGNLWIYNWNTIHAPTKYAENIAEYCGNSLAITKDRELVEIIRQEDGSYTTVKVFDKVRTAIGYFIIDEDNTLWFKRGTEIIKVYDNVKKIKEKGGSVSNLFVTQNNELWRYNVEYRTLEKVRDDVADFYDGQNKDFYLSSDGVLSYTQNGEKIVIAENVWHVIPPPYGYSIHYIKYLDKNGRAWTYFPETEEKRLDMENVIYAESGSYTFYICADGTLWADGRLLLTDVKLPEITEKETEKPKDSNNQQPSLEPWKVAYLDYISNLENKNEQEVFRLVYLDSDEIPELFKRGSNVGEGSLICSYKDGQIVSVQLKGSQKGCYIPKSGLVYNEHQYSLICYFDIYRLTDSGFDSLYCGKRTKTFETITNADGKQVALTHIKYYLYNEAEEMVVDYDEFVVKQNQLFDNSISERMFDNNYTIMKYDYEAIQKLIKEW